MGINFYSTGDLLALIGSRAKERRLGYGLRQADLAERAGVSISAIRRFEAGQSIGFDAIVSIALALRAEKGFLDLFPPTDPRSFQQILDSQKKRVRARKRS